MPILADTHVHVYPVYHTGKTFLRLAQNLQRLAAGAGDRTAAVVAMLTERQGQHVFRALRDGQQKLERDDVAVVAGAEDGALRVTAGGIDLHVLAGRQVVTAERIEVLCLTADADIPDGLPAVETIARILAEGGVPVLSWAPGKWFFARGRVMAGLLQQYAPAQVLLGDTTLRPIGWGEPGLMQRGRARGFRILAGSDPLPFADDDRVAGTYATWFAGTLDLAAPVQSVRAALHQATPLPRLVGRRGSLPAVLSRLRRNHRVRVG
ncbi:MAG: hypothetical protein K8T26_18790 [Lentisphaerae bacterium]|nr:hypothetical protein [Lentisphaerota bacterium]